MKTAAALLFVALTACATLAGTRAGRALFGTLLTARGADAGSMADDGGHPWCAFHLQARLPSLSGVG